MTTYELTYIISPDITSEEAQAKAKEIESSIQNKEGVILAQTNPIARTLAYQIEKRASGFFSVLEFQLEPEKMAELKETIEKDRKIVRHMLLVKRPVKIRKERRTRVKPEAVTSTTPEISQKTGDENKIGKEEKLAHVKQSEKEKVELKDIEQQLDELLG